MTEEKKLANEKRYLLIDCAGSGYQNEITEFFKNTYIKNGEYYDNLRVAGSILPFIVPELNNYCFIENVSHHSLIWKYFFENCYSFLKSQIRYLINGHQLNKVVVVGEPVCDFYKDLLSFIKKENKESENKKYQVFPSQKILFYMAIMALKDFLCSEFRREKIELEAHYIILHKDILFGKIYDNQYKNFYSNPVRFLVSKQ